MKKNKVSQKDQVLQRLLKHGYITRNFAIGVMNITRLAAIMLNLKKLGLPIIAEDVGGDFKYSLREDFFQRYKDIKNAREVLAKHGIAA